MCNNADNFCKIRKIDAFTGHLRWQVKKHLKDNVELYQKNAPDFAELCQLADKGEGLKQFFIDIVLDKQPPEDWEPLNRQELALSHLTSYFETCCQRAAQQVFEIYGGSWEDYWSIARMAIYNQDQLKKFLTNYKSELGTPLDTYVLRALINIIKTENDVGKYSPWRLLYKKSNKLLQQALEREGYTKGELHKLLFARKLFKKVYWNNKGQVITIRKGKRWLEPELKDFEETAQLYEQEMFLLSAPHEVAFGTIASTAEIQDWMNKCIDALQNFEVLLPEEVEEPEENSDSLLSELNQIFEPEMQRWNDIVQINIDENIWLIDEHKILPLYYGFRLIQIKIETIYGIRQYTVSRDKSKYSQKLLEVLGKFTQERKDALPEYVQNWLSRNCQSPDRSDLFQAALVSASAELAPLQRELLILHYGKQQLSLEQIAERQKSSLQDVLSELHQIDSYLQSSVLKQFDRWIKTCVKSWLSWYYESKISLSLHKVINSSKEHWATTVRLKYLQGYSESRIAQLHNCDPNLIREMLTEGEEKLTDFLIDEILEKMLASRDPESLRSQIKTFVKNWLEGRK